MTITSTWWLYDLDLAGCGDNALWLGEWWYGYHENLAGSTYLNKYTADQVQVMINTIAIRKYQLNYSFRLESVYT